MQIFRCLMRVEPGTQLVMQYVADLNHKGMTQLFLYHC